MIRGDLHPYRLNPRQEKPDKKTQHIKCGVSQIKPQQCSIARRSYPCAVKEKLGWRNAISNTQESKTKCACNKTELHQRGDQADNTALIAFTPHQLREKCIG